MEQLQITFLTKSDSELSSLLLQHSSVFRNIEDENGFYLVVRNELNYNEKQFCDLIKRVVNGFKIESGDEIAFVHFYNLVEGPQARRDSLAEGKEQEFVIALAQQNIDIKQTNKIRILEEFNYYSLKQFFQAKNNNNKNNECENSKDYDDFAIQLLQFDDSESSEKYCWKYLQKACLELNVQLVYKLVRLQKYIIFQQEHEKKTFSLIQKIQIIRQFEKDPMQQLDTTTSDQQMIELYEKFQKNYYENRKIQEINEMIFYKCFKKLKKINYDTSIEQQFLDIFDIITSQCDLSEVCGYLQFEINANVNKFLFSTRKKLFYHTLEARIYYIILNIQEQYKNDYFEYCSGFVEEVLLSYIDYDFVDVIQKKFSIFEEKDQDLILFNNHQDYSDCFRDEVFQMKEVDFFIDVFISIYQKIPLKALQQIIQLFVNKECYLCLDKKRLERFKKILTFLENQDDKTEFEINYKFLMEFEIKEEEEENKNKDNYYEDFDSYLDSV